MNGFRLILATAAVGALSANSLASAQMLFERRMIETIPSTVILSPSMPTTMVAPAPSMSVITEPEVLTLPAIIERQPAFVIDPIYTPGIHVEGRYSHVAF